MDALRSVCYDIEFEVNNNPLEKADKTVDDMTNSMQKLGMTAKTSGKAMSGSFKETNTDVDKLGKGVKKASDNIENMGKLTKGLFAGVTGAAVVSGITQITNKAYDLANGFANVEYTAAKVNTLAKQDLPTVLSDMRRLALDFGIEDANLVGEAMYQALSAGQNYKGLIDTFMDENLRISKAGFVDPLGAVDLTTTIMNTYQMEEVNGIGDALLATQDRGKTTVDEISQYYSKQFGAFRSIGVGYQDALSLLAETTRMGQRTADASTGIGSMLSEFSKSDSTVNDYFKELNGQTIPDFLKNGGDIIETISMIKSTLDVLNMSSFDMFGSVEAARTFETMTSDMNGLLSTQDSVVNSVGTLNESYKTMSNTTKTELEKASAAWNDFKTSLGESVAPATVNILENLVTLLQGGSVGDVVVNKVKKRAETFAFDPYYYVAGADQDDIGTIASVGKRNRAKKKMDTIIEEISSVVPYEELMMYRDNSYQKQSDLTNEYNNSTGDDRALLSAALEMNKSILETLDKYKTSNDNVLNAANKFGTPSLSVFSNTPFADKASAVTNATTTNESTQTQTTTVNNYITVTTQQEREVATKVANEIERSTIAYLPKSFDRKSMMTR